MLSITYSELLNKRKHLYREEKSKKEEECDFDDEALKSPNLHHARELIRSQVTESEVYTNRLTSLIFNLLFTGVRTITLHFKRANANKNIVNIDEIYNIICPLLHIIDVFNVKYALATTNCMRYSNEDIKNAHVLKRKTQYWSSYREKMYERLMNHFVLGLIQSVIHFMWLADGSYIFSTLLISTRCTNILSLAALPTVDSVIAYKTKQIYEELRNFSKK